MFSRSYWETQEDREPGLVVNAFRGRRISEVSLIHKSSSRPARAPQRNPDLHNKGVDGLEAEEQPEKQKKNGEVNSYSMTSLNTSRKKRGALRNEHWV